VKICPAVKADAYGHGAVAISKMIENERLADYLGVATIEEGIELRENGIKLPILLFGVTFKDQLYKAIKNNLTITIVSLKTLEETINICQQYQLKAKIHLKVDTGMGRIGAYHDEAIDIIKNANKNNFINLEGVFTHFPRSDERDKSFSINQIEMFKKLKNAIEKMEIKIPLYHMANSGAILDLEDSYFDMVRPGVMTYGYYPSKETTQSIEIYPSMKLRTEISFIKRVKRGTPISYGGTFVAPEDSYIATVPIGYADGLNRKLSNNHNVIINGKTYKIAGRVCMDQTMIYLKDDYYDIGTEVSFFDFNNITASDVAEELQTIPYEVTCWISKRVKRYYIDI
ncbi:MAG: alanine racemase, partial [Exilispira sp.]